MKKYIFIGFGGFLGAILRFLLSNIHINSYHENIPLNTLAINITGSFILALVMTLAFEISGFSINLRLGIATGFLGAYTTFSTLCKEAALLIQQGLYFSAISYLSISVMLGLTASYFGVVLARELVLKFVEKNDASTSALEGEAS